MNHLDYVETLGFDAIWISPVVTNTNISDGFGDSYHGFWASDLYTVNSHFGTEQDLIDLADALHKRGMYLMIDVVANHMGLAPQIQGTDGISKDDFSSFVPFNDSSHYHDCSNCPKSCWISDWTNQNEIEQCRLAGLPDLNQSVPFVAETLTSWVSDYVVKKWKADGIRIDTVCEVEKPFWCKFQKAAGVYAVGEASHGDPKYVGPYQDCLDGVMSYPMFYTIRDVFGSGHSMTELNGRIDDYRNNMNDARMLGNFVDNHDQDRFLCDSKPENGNYHRKYINALTFAMTFTGIPIIYQGTAHAFDGVLGEDGGCSDPFNR